MSRNLVDVEQRVLLGTITEQQCNQAVATIARHATDRADLLNLLDMIRPTPHTPDAGESRRRALPRRGVEG